MIVTTFNIRGWTSEKDPQVRSLVRKADLVCLTETWQTSGTHVFSQAQVAWADGYTSTRKRMGGGVVLLASPHSRFRHLESVTEQSYQVATGQLNGIVVAGVYLKPRATTSDLQALFFTLPRITKGKAIILGGFNARHPVWDAINTRQGRLLAEWAGRTRFMITTPLEPTVVTKTGGTSKVDLILTRNLNIFRPKVVPGQWSEISDHRSVQTELLLDTPKRLLGRVPRQVLTNPATKTEMESAYARKLPQLLRDIENVKTPEALEQISVRLAHAFLAPWLANFSSKPERFRKGWTRQADKLAKERSRLFKWPPSPDRKQSIRRLDRDIRYLVKKEKRRVHHSQTSELEGMLSQADTLKMIKRLQKSKGDLANITLPDLDPDDFTAHMQSLQPESDHSLPPSKFVLPPGFESLVLFAILSMKDRTAPGPDTVHPEMLRLNPRLAAKVITALWSQVSQQGYVPRLFRLRNTLPGIQTR